MTPNEYAIQARSWFSAPVESIIVHELIDGNVLKSGPMSLAEYGEFVAKEIASRGAIYLLGLQAVSR